MELIEKVVAAVKRELAIREMVLASPQRLAELQAQRITKATIRAMLDGVEPVAWRYDKGALAVVFIHRQNDMDHWTETPPYSLDALKEAVK